MTALDRVEVGAPVLVVHGAADLVIPAEHGRWLGRRLLRRAS